MTKLQVTEFIIQLLSNQLVYLFGSLCGFVSLTWQIVRCFKGKSK